MIQHLIRLMHANDATVEQFERLGLGKEYEAFLMNGVDGTADL